MPFQKGHISWSKGKKMKDLLGNRYAEWLQKTRRKPRFDTEKYYRKLAKENLPYKCAICGKSDRLEVHHKDDNRKNNNLENLEYLCKRHHLLKHPERYIKISKFISKFNKLESTGILRKDSAKGRKHSEETKRKISLKKKEKKLPPFTKEHKLKISLAHQGMKKPWVSRSNIKKKFIS